MADAMDTIALAIVAAAVACEATRPAAGTTGRSISNTRGLEAAQAAQAAEQGVLNAYGALKNLIARKLGVDNKVNAVIADLECVPHSDGYRGVLCRQLRKVGADQDPDLLTAAQVLLVSLYAYPPGAQIVRQVMGRARRRARVSPRPPAPS